MTKSQSFLNIILLPVIIVLAIGFAYLMVASKPERKVQKPAIVIPSVSVIETSSKTIEPSITTYGNIRSYYEAQLSSQVSGEIIHIAPSFNAGNMVKKGDLLLEIDPADYLAVIAQQEASFASAQQGLAEEKIRSSLASEDWIQSGRAIEKATDLTLRKPQLAAAEASVASTKASLQKAKLDLERTKIHAPFDAIVQTREASPGNIVNSGTSLGSLVATERAEVRLPLTPEQVKRIKLPLSGSKEPQQAKLQATLTTPSQPNNTWDATITRTEPNVDPQNQVIFVVGEIESPFDDPQNFLPIGAFVDAQITAKPIENAHQVPNTALVEDSFVWIIDSENKIQKQAVTRILSEGNNLIVRFESTTLPEPYKIATRPLSSFRSGQTVNPVSLKN